MNGRILTIRRIIQSSLITTGVIRYYVTYIPKLNAYRITLVGGKQGISGQSLGKIIESLSANGFSVWVKTSKMPMFNVVYLYARVPQT